MRTSEKFDRFAVRTSEKFDREAVRTSEKFDRFAERTSETFDRDFLCSSLQHKKSTFSYCNSESM